MSVKGELIENNRIALYTISDPWTLDELITAMNQAEALREQHFDGYHKIHSLTDLSGVRSLPSGNILSTHRQMPGLKHPSQGLLTVAGANTLGRIFMGTILRLSRKEGRFFETRDTAIAWLHEQIVMETIANDE
jgi:hypothetical protein